MILERYERDYGVGGVKVQVRHLMLNRGRAKSEMLKQGRPAEELTPAAVEEWLRTRAAALLDELAAGASFESVARRESHDLSVHQNGGIIPGYNYVRYGPAMAEAVRAAEVGVPAGPVVTPSALHLIQVESRDVTPLGQVREEIIAKLKADPATWEEMRQLEIRLRQGVEVRTY